MIRVRYPDGSTKSVQEMISRHISHERIARIRQLKQENPDANHEWLAVMAFDSEYAVHIALDYDGEDGLVPQVTSPFPPNTATAAVRQQQSAEVQ